MATTNKKAIAAKNSTLAIDAETSQKLDFFCKKNEITKKDFVGLALAYFERTGINIYSSETASDFQDEIREKIDSIYKLQADAAVKLTGIQQTTNFISEKQEDTTKLLETGKKKRKWWF